MLPRVCADRPPGREGYAPYGFTWEDGRRAPMGLPVMTVGFDRVGVNCALCHVGSMRLEPNGARRLLPGAPTSRVDLQGYLRFLFACADSPRFTADAILTEIRKVHSLLPAVESLLYRRLVIPRMKRALQAQKAQLSWMIETRNGGPDAPIRSIRPKRSSSDCRPTARLATPTPNRSGTSSSAAATACIGTA